MEGIIRDTVRDLSADQPLRRIQDEPTWVKIEALLTPLKAIVGYNHDDEDAPVVKEGEEKEVIDEDEKLDKAFTIKVDDPSGDSFIEFFGSMADPKWSMRTYGRTREQNVAIGLSQPDEDVEADGGAGLAKVDEEREEDLDGEEEGEKKEGEEIYVFHGICSSCGNSIDTRMKKVVIPYFKVRVHFHPFPA